MANKRDDIRLLANLLAQQKGDTPELRKQMKRHYWLSLGRYAKCDPFCASIRWIPDPDTIGYGTERCVVECEEHDTAEDVERWFKDEYWVTVSAPWDCTGEWFSCRVHAVKVAPTKAIVLHRMAMDI